MTRGIRVAALVAAATAVAAVALGADRQPVAAASAPQSPPSGVPATFVDLPDVAAQTREATIQAMGETAEPRVQAWGDPALGCFVIVTEQQVPGGDLAQITEALGQALEAAEFEVSDAATESGQPAQFDFTHAGMQGSVRLSAQPLPQQQGNDNALALRATACFYSQREPDISARLCSQVLRPGATSAGPERESEGSQ